MVAEVLEWNDGSMGDFVFDGQYMLSVSQTAFEVHKENKIFDNLTFTTDYPTWKAEAMSSGNWLSLTGNTTGNAGNNIPLSFSVEENTSEIERVGSITITAGRLSYIIEVKQTNRIGLDIRTSTDILEFPNYNIQPKTLTIDWVPANKISQLYFPSDPSW